MELVDLELNTTGLLVLQSTSFCNINCSYCYLPDRHIKDTMRVDDLERYLDKIFSFPTVRDNLTVLWHAGEPCVLPPSYYRSAISTIERVKPKWLRLQYSLLTNGTLIDAEWVRFLKESGVHLGVSVDGPKGIHDKRRVTRAGSGTFEKVASAMRLLKAEGVSYYVLCVLSYEDLWRVDEYVDFCREFDIESIGFNIDEVESINTTSGFDHAGSQEAFRDFLADFADRTSTRAPKLNTIREVSSMVQRIGSTSGELGYRSIVNEQTEPFRIISVSATGMISTFSPELLTSRHDRFGTFYFGNLNADEFYDIVGDQKFNAVYDEIRKGVARCRESCGYFSVCGGGAPVNKLFETGSMDAAETMFCRVTQKAVADLCLDSLLVYPEIQDHHPEG